MKKSYILSLFIVFVLFSSCRKDIVVAPGQEFILKENQCAKVQAPGGELKICFKEMLEDSRCPKVAYCIWAGRIKVQMNINGQNIMLATAPIDQTPDSVRISGLTVKLLDAEPYPEVKRKIRRYRIRMKTMN